MPFIVDLQHSSVPDKVKTELNQPIKEPAYTAGGSPDDELILKLDSDFIQDLYLDDKFNSLLNAWKVNTWFESNSNNIIRDENFQEIINLGEQAIPLIIKEIDEEPSQLVWALNIITGMHIKSPYRMNLTESCKKWVELYKKGRLDLRK